MSRILIIFVSKIKLRKYKIKVTENDIGKIYLSINPKIPIE